MKDYVGCPVQATSKALAGKWKVKIVWYLSFASRRFGELRKLMPGISEKVLAEQLRQLEKDGIVSRCSSESIPPRVDYDLCPAGKDLIPVMQVMCDWGAKHFNMQPSLTVPTTLKEAS